MLCSFLN